uniref:Uncharacterized protein n=1 Tax=Sphaeramia orbicularis TaxID=375764 RepID=A0A673AYN7_9TELE
MKPNSLSSRLFGGNGADTLNISAAKYQRQVDHPESTEDFSYIRTKNDKSHREINFAFLPERYEPLVESDEAKEEKKRRKKEKYKKVKKNVGKALRSTWKCLMLGLYNFAIGYSTPITVAATFVPDFHQSRDRPFF